MQITDANRQEWLDRRRQSIGASEAFDVLSRPLSLYFRKLGLVDEPEPTWAMRRGLALEPLLKSEYERATGERIVLTQEFCVHPERPEISATADGVTLGGELVEFKSVNHHVAQRELGDPGTDQIPDRWRCQAYVQMAVHEAGIVRFAVDVAGMEFRLYEVVRRDSMIDPLLDRISAFWHDHIVPRRPPASDAADLETMARVIPDEGTVVDLPSEADFLAHQLRQAKAMVKHWGAKADAHQAGLIALMGTHGTAHTPAGRVLTRKRIDVKESVRKASHYYRFNVNEKGIEGNDEHTGNQRERETQLSDHAGAAQG